MFQLPAVILRSNINENGKAPSPEYSEGAFLLFPKILCNFPHPPALLHLERAAPVAVAAVPAGRGLRPQLPVVVFRQLIPSPCQIIVLVHQPDVNARRAGVAVAAIHTVPLNILGRKLSDKGVIPLLLRGIGKREQLV